MAVNLAAAGLITAHHAAEWARICARRPDVHACDLIRRWLANVPDGTNHAYRAWAYLEVTGDPVTDALRAMDLYWANEQGDNDHD